MRFPLTLALALLLPALPARGADIVHSVAGAILLHDRSYFSDFNEGGIDLNAEVTFRRPWSEHWLAPYPHVGATLNLWGDTSYAYAGLAWEAPVQPLFLGAAVGLAVHNGRLERTEEACRDDNCGFGSRATIRLAAEIGWWIDDRNSVSLLVDHISHAGWFAEQNEGVDNVGIRWRRRL